MSDQATVRVYAEEDKMLPVALIRGVLCLMAATLAIAIYARVTDRPLESTPPVSPVVAETHLLLTSDGVSGAVQVHDPSGTLISNLGPEAGGFIAGVHRVIIRERTKHRAATDGPILLQAFENGRMAITDPSTGWSADLMGFGADNASAFARVLAATQKGNANGTTN